MEFLGYITPKYYFMELLRPAKYNAVAKIGPFPKQKDCKQHTRRKRDSFRMLPCIYCNPDGLVWGQLNSKRLPTQKHLLRPLSEPHTYESSFWIPVSSSLKQTGHSNRRTLGLEKNLSIQVFCHLGQPTHVTVWKCRSRISARIM